MKGQKSKKGADSIILKRKIYQQFLDWKEERNGEVALLVEGARRIGKSVINASTSAPIVRPVNFRH